MRNYLLLILFLLSGFSVFAQLPIASNYAKAYSAQTRSTNGAPGKHYWQNSADYAIQVKFNPKNLLLTGKVSINYWNQSPDTLHKIVLKLYPNLYQSQAMRNVQLAAEDLTTGVAIQSVAVNEKSLDAAKWTIRGTNMTLKNATVLPGQHVKLELAYSYSLNKGSFMRTGQVDSGAFVLAYFFPRVAVYDDIDGWNEYPYIGKEEFYNDYCDFKVAITLPGNYAVWGTGNLENAGEVYQTAIVQRLAEADRSDSVATIISENDLKNGGVLLPAAEHTWHFEAANVTDFAFAASDHYIWKASSLVVDSITKRRSKADAVYNPLHHQYDPVCAYARKTLELISYQVPAIPFPYPHVTIFEGLDAMEYPMMVNNLPFGGAEAVEFTAHEVFHSLFPFWVGSNETKYSFMDEGLATFSEFTFAQAIDPSLPDTYDLSPVNETAGGEQDVPIMTLTPQLYGAARFSDKDLKPALGFRYVRELLGAPLFNKALQYYISQWKGKHPGPYDMFNCLNKGASVNLDWFWQNWFFEKNVPDLAISKVSKQAVTITRIGKGIVPIHLKITYRDGSVQQLTKAIDCWKNGNKTITMMLPFGKKIKHLQLGDGYDADVNAADNSWN